MTGSLVFVPHEGAVEEHPAVRAWLELGGDRPPTSVEELVVRKRRRPTRPVYRLHGAGPDGEAVVAKLAPQSTALRERLVYQDVLSPLPVPSPRCYGLLEPGDGSGWLFLEDVGGEPYSEADERHRALAAEWFGVVHPATSRLDLAATLPEHGPGLFLADLRAARETISANLGNPELGVEDVAVLERILGHCDALESVWHELERFCDSLPRCLVHGDFCGKNARVRAEPDGPVLYVLDWEAAGWGVPVADVAVLDSGVYGAHLRAWCPWLGFETVAALPHVAMVFHALTFIKTWSTGLAASGAERTASALAFHEAELAGARRRLGW